MKPRLLKILICPECKVPFNLDVKTEKNGQIETGNLCCTGKKCNYPINNFVPRFVDKDTYADSFSKQRLYVKRHFKHYEKDKSGYDQFLDTTGFKAEALKSGITLEIGCGYGRFLDVVDNYGGEVVGLDLSTHSIELSQKFVGLRKNVHLVQADLYNLPFRKKAIDRIYSIGVLHHTPSTRNAFCALIPSLKLGGQISIWVYPPSDQHNVRNWRKLTTRLPHSLLYSWCILNQGLFSSIRGLPGGWRFSKIIPGTQPTEGSFWLRVMNDFDNLSPTYAHSHSREEVIEWFANAGLTEVKVLSRHTAVTGVKEKDSEEALHEGG